VAEYFGLDGEEARMIAREIGQAVGGWRKQAVPQGLFSVEIDRMASVFEHDDLRQATRR